jgi:dTDP-4-dehydrorhamnose reductase
VPSIEINSLLPHKLADACTDVGARLIHFSTDCVFSGSRGAYSETDTPDATDLYGRSKLLGEVDYGPHLTLRTSIIGHELDKAVSLVDWFLHNEGPISGYVNAVFSGMPTVYIAEFLRAHVFCGELRGLYHLSVEPINKYKLLCLIKDQYGLSTEISPYEDFRIDRSLNSEKLRSATGFVSPAWEDLITKMREEYLEYFV